jgi:HK97 family phage major capsid protein
MTKKEYETKRNSLMTDAKNLLKNQKTEEANAKLDEVKALDTEYKNFATAQANALALEGTPSINLAPTPVAPVAAAVGTTNTDENPTNSMAYRKAFMNYALHGKEMPKDLGASVTSTTEGGAVIPQTILDRIIENLQSSGMILPLVTQTAYKGGVSIPVSLVKPTGEWVSEGSDATGAKLSVKTANMITFAYYKLKVKVAITLEMAEMAISSFETMIVNNITQAITIALETAIIAGTGSGQPKGILTETPPTGQSLTTSAVDPAYADLVACEAALPLAYENGAVWCMSKKAFMAFIGMVDSNKQPIARVNYGINGAPERTLLGRTVILNDYMTYAAGKVMAFLFRFPDYILNTNMNITISVYTDDETDDKITKAIMLVDGKVVDVNSLVTLTKKSA